jgi:hypothetical protein
MSRHAKTIRLIETARDILAEAHPMTVRQIYYQLVSRQVIKNDRSQYQAVSKALVEARREGTVPWDWIEDRLRRPRHVSMWDGLGDFADTCRKAYRRDVWATQPAYLEVWLEKDALSGIFEDALNEYGVTLNVGRGYDGWASIHNAALRFGDGNRATVLYFGDFDPSGEDMVRSLRERLADCGSRPEIIKSALNAEDIEHYKLPPDFTKSSDTRAAAFVARHGDRAVELDALPADVLRDRLFQEVSGRMDLAAWRAIRQQEEAERRRLTRLLIGT